MPFSISRSKEYTLLPRDSLESLPDVEHTRAAPAWKKPWHRSPFHALAPRGLGRLRAIVYAIEFISLLVVLLIVLTPLLNPSYSNKPSHYTGSNHRNEKVFIAAAITNAELIRGPWGKSVLELIDIIGPENAFLSVYENDSGPDTTAALGELKEKVKCKHRLICKTTTTSEADNCLGDSSIVSEHLPLDGFPTVTIPSGDQRVKRIAYLAEIRNRAMRPLYARQALEDQSPQNTTSPFATPEQEFDKVLFLNDVVFSATDAADLLFATRIGPDMRTRYRAACAVDFINAVKFYDTFATRDLEGYGIGVPFFPWFTGTSETRQDVLDQTDAVRVRSCWGGMVAFEAKWFAPEAGPGSAAETTSPTNVTIDTSDHLRFRSEEELFWEASESCLIHADLQEITSNVEDDLDPELYGTGIFLNPYIRVAYTESSFRWLWLAKRFERMYPFIHSCVSWGWGKPSHNNPRQFEEPGQKVVQRSWVYENENESRDEPLGTEKKGCYQEVERIASPGGFCGSRKLLTLKSEWKQGERMWQGIQTPSLDLVC